MTHFPPKRIYTVVVWLILPRVIDATIKLKMFYTVSGIVLYQTICEDLWGFNNHVFFQESNTPPWLKKGLRLSGSLVFVVGI
jgi:hypothetical protein